MLGSAYAAPIALTPTPRTTLAVVHRARIRPLRGGPLAQQSPRTVFPNMKPPSKQEAPIVRGDGANKNDEFSRANQKMQDGRGGRASMHPSRPFGAGLGATRLRASGAGLRVRGADGGRAEA